MGILPKINFNEVMKRYNIEEERKNKFGKTFLIDFTRKKMLKRDGKLIKTDDERAVRMWIEKVLLTEKDKWLIYKDTEYGMEYRANLLGKRYPRPFLKAEFIRELNEVMATNPKIQEISNLEIEFNRHLLHTKFTVKLDNFKIFEWEADL